MAGEILDADLVDSFGERIVPTVNTAVQGLIVQIRWGFRKVKFKFVAVGGRLALNPAIKDIYLFDASRSAGARFVNLLDENKNLINANVTTGTGTVLDTLKTADFIYVRTNARHGGLRFEMIAANDAASIITAAYSKTDNTFAATAISDGTDVAGDTLKQDGNIVIDTVPTDWERKTLQQLGIVDVDAPAQAGHWFRLDVSADLDSDFEVDVIAPLHSDFGEGITSGHAGFYDKDTEYSLDLSKSQVGALEIGMQTGAAGVGELTWYDYSPR